MTGEEYRTERAREIWINEQHLFPSEVLNR